MSNLPKSEFPFTKEQVKKFVISKLTANQDTYIALKQRAADYADKELDFFQNMTGAYIMDFLAMIYPTVFEDINHKQLGLLLLAQGMARELFTMMVNEREPKGPVQ